MTERIRTIRRRKGENPPETEATEAPAQAVEAAKPAPSRAIPVKRKPEGPRIDAAALEAEAKALSPDDLASLMSGAAPRDPEPGQQVTGVVASITDQTIFVSVGAKSEATLDRSSMADPDNVAVGDRITAFVLSAGARGIQITEKISGSGSREMLEEAYQKRVPVEGKVVDRNPGGFNVDLAGVKAFCPASQIARFPEEDGDSYTGRTMLFLITEYKERDVVVSARAFEEVEAAIAANQAWETLAEGDVTEGTVVSVQDFGVFVDIGGVQGLLHKSEIGLGADVEMPVKGDKVNVRVKSIDKGKDRISLSLKDGSSGPWATAETDFVEGDKYPGTISRVVDFGAFVTLADGLEGLIHVSQLAEHRVDHARSVVKVGQAVEVRVVEVDVERKRIGLSMKKNAGDGRNDWNSHQKAPGKKQSLGTLADLLGNLKLS